MSRKHTKFETFDAALDEFYSKIESQRSEQQQKAKESSATQKLNKIRMDQVCPVNLSTDQVHFSIFLDSTVFIGHSRDNCNHR